MEASERSARKLDSEKAQRIVAAMRASVARRGAAGATFDHVAQEAGVSRGLLHYYFGSKERLLVEVVRSDTAQRIERLGRHLAAAGSVDAILEALVAALDDLLARDPEGYSIVFELYTASRHNDDLRVAVAELQRELRAHVAAALREKDREGVVALRAEPEAVAALLFALSDGIALQVLSDPGWNSEQTLAAAIQAARYLLGADG